MGLSQRRRKLIARLLVPKTRAREGLVLVEGVRAVTEALDAGVSVSFAVVSARLGDTADGASLVRRLAAHDVERVEEPELESVSHTETTQGVLLVGVEPVSGLECIRPGGRYLVLDGIQDPGNAGTLVRAAVAFGLDAVVCLDGTVDPWGPKPVRASAGMIFRVPVVRAPLADVLSRIEEVGVPLHVADTEGEDVEVHPIPESFALVLGNEGRGVRAGIVEASVRRVAVRMPGGAESLNVAMAGSVLLHALTRREPGE